MSTSFALPRALARRSFVLIPVLLSGLVLSHSSIQVFAQVGAPAAAAAAVRGTVKSISGSTITLTTDTGTTVTITPGGAVRILQAAPGSTKLTPIALDDISAGDRISASVKADDTPGQLTATRILLMKSTDVAQKRAQDQADWQKRGSGGIVAAMDAGTGTLMVTQGAKKLEVKTSSTTIFRRYSGDSVKFEDAVPGTIAQLQVGDQLRFRGAKSEDGTSTQAEEIVSGSFKNLAGTIATINATDGTITLKDLATKKIMTVKVTANTDLRRLPERAAAMFAARARGGAAATAGAAGGRPGGTVGAAGATAGRASSAGAEGAAGASGAGRLGVGEGAGAGRSAGMDLSQMLSRLPNESIADLKVGEAVMIVASEATPSSTSVTAITLLTGVEPILAATPSGAPMTLSPWSVGGGAPEGGGGQ